MADLDRSLEETCREWPDPGFERCNEQADFILWGKLFDPNALGPRCYKHTEQWIGVPGMYRIDQYAVYDLRRVRAAVNKGKE